MRYWILVSCLVCSASASGLAGCGSAESEKSIGSDEASLSSSAGFSSGGASGGCSPYVCQKYSTTDLTGRSCSCLALGVPCSGVLRNDKPLTPRTYFCRAQ